MYKHTFLSQRHFIMISNRSRERRRKFCRRARRRDTALRSLYARRILKPEHHQKPYADMPSTITFNTQNIMNHRDSRYGQPSQPTIVPRTLAPARIFNHASVSYTPAGRSANSVEIYGLALGTCFLAIFLGWILFILAREGFGLFRNRWNASSQRTDPEIGYTPERGTPNESRLLLSHFRNVSSEAEELIKSAQRAGANIATVLKRDMGELRRRTHPTRRRVDEEEALNDTGGDGFGINRSFLLRT
ncbi:hypothetical protein F5B19DRAFT_21519 [Rostrohypoxylon terebratum]|nr:hypothetical protein F5B19DRAFT_21519 [Rostrohypoxylon terebratum]